MKLLGIMKLWITIRNINMYKYKMKTYCLKFRKDTENINLQFQKEVMVEQCYYQIVQYVIVKNQDLLKIKKQKDY